MARYDRAITIFSPDGHLFQVEYAQEAVKKGSTAVGVRGKTAVVIAVEKKSSPLLQDDRTIRKIHRIDDHAFLAFAGLNADARVLVSQLRNQAQSHKLNREDPATLKEMTKHVAAVKQRFTQSNGRRPFGVSMILGGVDPDGTPRLFQTEPSGAYYEYKANATGRSQKTVMEFLEKHWSEEAVADEAKTLRLALKALSEVVQSGPANIEVALLTKDPAKPSKTAFRVLSVPEIEAILKEIAGEKEAAAKDASQPPPQ